MAKPDEPDEPTDKRCDRLGDERPQQSFCCDVKRHELAHGLINSHNKFAIDDDRCRNVVDRGPRRGLRDQRAA